MLPILSASENHFDATGALDRIQLGTGWLTLHAAVKIPEFGWQTVHTPKSDKTTFADSNGKKFWQMRLGDREHTDVEVIQTVTPTPDGLRFDFAASAFKDSDIEGLIFAIDLPAALFSEGSFESTGKDAATGYLPEFVSRRRILNSGTLKSIHLSNPSKSIRFNADFDAPVNAVIQDSRQWTDHFTLLIYAHEGMLQKGQTTRFGLVLNAAGSPDQTPATFSIDPNQVRYSVSGLGGNYCFSLDAPEKARTLTELKPQFARTEISLAQWLPQKGGAATPTSGKLPLEFQLMRELSALRIPYIASIWNAPEWLTRKVTRIDGSTYTFIPDDSLRDATEVIGAYLQYAKDHFQSEPDYVSFNEPDYGAQIKFTPEQHRDAIKLLGAECVKRGLKTRCLLGDVSTPQTRLDYLLPALQDATAMSYVGALSFHSWGGASQLQYAAWNRLAREHNLPLIVAEAGVDADAWKTHSFQSFDNALREMSQYQDLLQFARPQAILYWEYTSDYSLLNSDPKHPELQTESERFAFQRHWLRAIPPGSEALETSGTHAQIALTAFRKKDANATHYAFNLSNTGWSRKTKISGIPPEIQKLNVIQTSRGSLFKALQPISPVNGSIEIDLPEESLTTLTTLK